MGCVRFLVPYPMRYTPLHNGQTVQRSASSWWCLTHPANASASKFYPMPQSGAQHALDSPREKSALKGPFCS